MILRFIFTLVLLYCLYRIAKALFLPSGRRVKPLSNRREGEQGEDLVEDPFCHTYIPVSEARKLDIDGKVVYFCSQKCLEVYQSHNKEKKEA